MKKSVVGAVLAIIAVVFVILYFVGKTRDNEASVVNDNVIGIAKANAAAVRQTFLDYTSSLNIAARFIEKYDDFNSDEVMSILAKIAKKEKLERIAINFPNGKSHTSDGHVVDYSHFGTRKAIIFCLTETDVG